MSFGSYLWVRCVCLEEYQGMDFEFWGLIWCRLNSAGIRSPTPILLRLHVLVMSFIGVSPSLSLSLRSLSQIKVFVILNKLSFYRDFEQLRAIMILTGLGWTGWPYWLKLGCSTLAGKDGWAAPRLKDASISQSKMCECYVEVRHVPAGSFVKHALKLGATSVSFMKSLALLARCLCLWII
jgi:hypothetical protein